MLYSNPWLLHQSQSLDNSHHLNPSVVFTRYRRSCNIRIMRVKMMVQVSLCLLLFATYTVAETDEELCMRRADVALVLDDSKSISTEDFKVELDFAQALVEHFGVSEARARFAAVTFGSGSREVFPFGKFKSASEVKDAIKGIVKRDGNTTDIFAGLKYARETLFKVARPGAAKVIILVTDGLSQRMYDSIEEAHSAFSNGITVIVIGVGRFDTTELAKLSSHPPEKYTFVVPVFSNLTGIQRIIADHICKAPAMPPCDTEVLQECKGKERDVVFLIDRSSSIGNEDFQKQLSFFNNITDIFDIGPNTTHVAAVSFSSYMRVELLFDEFANKRDIKAKISNIAYTGGTRQTWGALQAVRNVVFVKSRGLRDNADKIVIVVTGGSATEREKTREVAKSVRDKGFHVFAVGVGPEITTEELRELGSKPFEEYVFQVVGFHALGGLRNKIAFGTCVLK